MMDNKPHLCLIGCGNMGGAMLKSWHANHAYTQCDIIKPSPSSALSSLDKTDLYSDISQIENRQSDIVIFAVKPQKLDEVLTAYTTSGHKANLYISIAAGVSLNTFQKHLGDKAKIIRAMPNTPAAIQAGLIALYANSNCLKEDKQQASALMSYLGKTLWLDQEQDMHAVTAISGSGPAYVFHFIESLEKAALAQGLPSETAKILARQTVIGASLLAQSDSDIEITKLRKAVTSPGGTTEAGLKILMQKKEGLATLIDSTIKAAIKRSKDLAD